MRYTVKDNAKKDKTMTQETKRQSQRRKNWERRLKCFKIEEEARKAFRKGTDPVCPYSAKDFMKHWEIGIRQAQKETS